MARSVTILGTVHEIQGAENSPRKKIEDPFFLTLVDHFLRGKDFAYEPNNFSESATTST